MIIEMISQSISTKEWDQAGIGLQTHGSAVGLAMDCEISHDLILFKHAQYKEYQCHFCNLTHYYLTNRKQILLQNELS